MTKLSVNINKIATLRNARGGNVPDLIKIAIDLEKFGAEGITIHPRPDERHIRRKDVFELKPVLKTEFNISADIILNKKLNTRLQSSELNSGNNEFVKYVKETLVREEDARTRLKERNLNPSEVPFIYDKTSYELIEQIAAGIKL